MAGRKRRVLITGVSRWWGALLAQRLIQDEGIAEVIGVDTEDPHYDLGDADFLKVDVRHSLIGKLVRSVGIDTVVHTDTTIDSFSDDARTAHETNVVGTLNLLAGCAGDDSPVRRLVLKSSAHVYGSRHDLPMHVREDYRLASSSPHPFVRDIVEVESNFFDFAIRNPKAETVVLRFANSLNADEPAPLARYFDLPVVPTVLGFDPVLQLVHRDDCIEALRKATHGGGSGAYNIAGEHPLPLSVLLSEVGKVPAPVLPPAGLGLVSAALKAMNVAFLSPQLIDLLRWGRTVSTAKAAAELDFRAARDTLTALDDYIQQRRVLDFLPSHRAYQYDRELEEYIHARRTRQARLRDLVDRPPAAVDDYRLAVDVGGRVGGQEHNRFGHLGRLADPVQRVGVDDPAVDLLVLPER